MQSERLVLHKIKLTQETKGQLEKINKMLEQMQVYAEDSIDMDSETFELFDNMAYNLMKILDSDNQIEIYEEEL